MRGKERAEMDLNMPVDVHVVELLDLRNTSKKCTK